MNPKITCLLIALSFWLSGAAFAAGAKTYQVTGTVIEATGSMVTVQKGTEKWEIDIDPATTKGFGDLKVGAKVTISYVMSATKVEASSVSTAPVTSTPKLGATAPAAAAETTPAQPSAAPTP
jgi:uncharacterized protein GlcG (DUF336 family)